MFQKVKLALRIKSAAFDDEISGLIAAAADDLRSLGVWVPEIVTETVTNGSDPPPDPPEEIPPRVQRAIILYCKAHYGYMPAADAERFLRAYDLQKSALHFERGRNIAME